MYVLSEWLLLNTKWAIFQLFHDDKKLDFKEIMMMIIDTLIELRSRDNRHIDSVKITW